MPPRWRKNRLTAKLGIDYPVIQGPLGGLSSQKLTAAVSNFGGLGSFGARGLSPGAIKDVIAEIRSLTSKPFAMNLWVSMEDEGARTSDENAFNRSLAPLTSHLAADEITRSGKRASQKAEIVSWLRMQQRPLTSMEIAHAATMDRYMVARRLPDLERDGRVERCAMRECTESNRPAITWRDR